MRLTSGRSFMWGCAPTRSLISPVYPMLALCCVVQEAFLWSVQPYAAPWKEACRILTKESR